jgi:hypothetical protein
MEQYLMIFQNSVKKINVLLQFDKNDRYFMEKNYANLW